MTETIVIGGTEFAAMNNGFGIAEGALTAARLGLAGCGKLNAKTGIDSLTVLNDAGFLVAIPTGKRIVVTCFYIHLNTASDWITAELGYTANADGSGDFVALSPAFRIESGAANQSDAPIVTQVLPPAVVPYSATAKAFTMRVQGNDSSASGTFGFNYWIEDIE